MHSAQIVVLVIMFNALANFANVVIAKRIPQFAGPWKPIIQRAENGSVVYTLPRNPKFWTKVFFTPARHNEQQYAWGQIFIGVPVNDDLQAEVRIAKKSNNQWKPNAFVMKFDKACTNLVRHMKWAMDMIYGKGNYTSECPIPTPGFIEITNKTVNPEFPAFPVFPYGVWRFTIAVFKGKTLLGATDAMFESVPKL